MTAEPTRYREVVLTSWDRGTCVPRPNRYARLVLTSSIGYLDLGDNGLRTPHIKNGIACGIGAAGFLGNMVSALCGIGALAAKSLQEVRKRVVVGDDQC